ncbi:MAG: hypothetical protein R6U86_07985 [Bacteroidales bacterium]
MKKPLGLLMLIVVVVLAGCEKEEEISGDSFLQILNESKYSMKIYFDSSFIGRVSSEESETWSVPSGRHTIKATCSFSQNYEGTHNFVTGLTTVIRLEIENKYSESFIVLSGFEPA